MTIKSLTFVLPWLFLLLAITNVVAGESDHAAKQAELDQACEIARQAKLEPLRRQYVEECVVKQDKDKTECEKFYSDFGVRTGNRAALFYDLPKCVEAFENGKL